MWHYFIHSSVSTIVLVCSVPALLYLAYVLWHDSRSQSH